MNRIDLVCSSTHGEFLIAYHVEAATMAKLAAKRRDTVAARVHAQIARSWLRDYMNLQEK